VTLVKTERFIDHIGSEKTPIRIVQQWGILVNSLTAEPAIWGNESIYILNIYISTTSYKVLNR